LNWFNGKEDVRSEEDKRSTEVDVEFICTDDGDDECDFWAIVRPSNETKLSVSKDECVVMGSCDSSAVVERTVEGENELSCVNTFIDCFSWSWHETHFSSYSNNKITFHFVGWYVSFSNLLRNCIFCRLLEMFC
jgi:hypothetical protein